MSQLSKEIQSLSKSEKNVWFAQEKAL
jgi:hypothetical protein